MNDHIVKASTITKAFGTPPHEVLHPTSLSIAPGEYISISGKSGSGKSTLLYILSGLDEPTSGHVELLGIDTASRDHKLVHAMRNHQIGFVFQFHYLLSELTALENILMPARKQGRQLERLDRAQHLLKHFDIAHCESKRPGQMSGGEQQRVAIARSLIMEPAILFADEPTGNLDTANSDIVMALLKQENRESGRTVVFITHDDDHSAAADRRIVMQDGCIIEDHGHIETKTTDADSEARGR